MIAGKGHGGGVGVRASLDRDLTLAEVTAQRLVETDDRRFELRLAIVEAHVGVGDLEFPETHRERLGGLRLGLRCGLLRDVPVGAPVLELDERESGLVELDGADDERLAAHDVPEHAREIEHDTEMTYRGEGIVLKSPGADRGQLVEREREVREALEEGQADIAPVDVGVEVPVRLQLRTLRDFVAEEERQREQQHEHERDQCRERSRDLRRSFHL